MILGIVAVSLVACLALFLALKREIVLLRREHAEESQKWIEDRRRMESSLVKLRQALAEPAEPPHPAPPPPPSPVLAPAAVPSLNMTKRSQALRRWRRGETSEQIAQALDMPRTEIDLLIKAFQAATGEARAAAGAKR